MAAAERIERGYLGSLLRLTLLAPDMVEAILDGQRPGGLTLPSPMVEPAPVIAALHPFQPFSWVSAIPKADICQFDHGTITALEERRLASDAR